MIISASRAVGAGFVGALVNAAAIRLVQAAGIDAGTGGFARWFFAHVNLAIGTHFPTALGPFAQEMFHTTVGIASALIYAGLFHRLLPGPRWLRGLVYCQTMWIVQAFVVLPWLGRGYMGIAISPATPYWSWALNAVYGLVIGVLYRPVSERPHTSGR
ncbi:MAG: hypothetical protein ABI877_13220 [Gemmatimonadaceae bacterium]